ncbi:MAG: hypothetical protein M5U14_20745 [Acidimicrobiia bacterium]|nr:hypothetical protein [Acidimicrobiia bacterium]
MWEARLAGEIEPGDASRPTCSSTWTGSQGLGYRRLLVRPIRNSRGCSTP